MFIAFREFKASLGRFVLLTVAVSLLVVLLLFFQSVANSLTTGITGGVENNGAEVFVYGAEARRNPSASFLSPEVVGPIGEVSGVRLASPVSRGTFTVGTGDDADDVAVVGLVDPEAGPAEVEEGRRAEASGEALVSTTSLAQGFEVGDQVTIEDTTFEVVGVVADATFDVSTTLYVQAEDLEALTASRSGGQALVPISWVAVFADDDVDGETLAQRITSEVADVDAVDRATAAEALPGADQITQSFAILYLLLFIVVTSVTGVFFLILTVQKQSSLVLLRAIGGSRWDVVKPVLIQVAFVVGIGALLGVAIAAGLLEAARDVFGSTLDPRTTVITVVAIIVLGLLASLGAVRRVLAVDPVEATTGGGGIQ